MLVTTSRLEWILHQNSIFAFGACGKQGNRPSHQFFHSPDIFNRQRRQSGPRTRVGGRLLPALDGLIDRFDPRLSTLASRQMVDLFTIELIADTNLDGLEAIKNVELGQSKAMNTAGANGLADQHRIKPAAAALAAGVDAEFAPMPEPLAACAATVLEEVT